MSKGIDYIQSISEVKIAGVVSTSPDALYHRKKMLPKGHVTMVDEKESSNPFFFFFSITALLDPPKPVIPVVKM